MADAASTATVYAKAQVQGTVLANAQGQQTAESQQQIGDAMASMEKAAQNGIPSDPNDQGKLAYTMAVGIAAFAFPPYAALMAALYAAAQPIADALFSVGLLQKPSCTHTGPTVQPSDFGTPPASQNGPQAALWAICADQLARLYNCQGAMPGAIIYDNFQKIWDGSHDQGSGTTFAVFDFAPSFPDSSVIQYFGWDWVSTDPGFRAVQGQMKPLSLHSGAYTGPKEAAETASPAAGKSIVGHASAVAVGGVAAGLIYAVATGRAANAVFDGAWEALKHWVIDAFGAVERVTSPTVAENRRKRRRRR